MTGEEWPSASLSLPFQLLSHPVGSVLRVGREGSRQWREAEKREHCEGEEKPLKTPPSALHLVPLPAITVHEKLLKFLHLPSSRLLAPRLFFFLCFRFVCLLLWFAISHDKQIKMPSQTDSTIHNRMLGWASCLRGKSRRVASSRSASSTYRGPVSTQKAKRMASQWYCPYLAWARVETDPQWCKTQTQSNQAKHLREPLTIQTQAEEVHRQLSKVTTMPNAEHTTEY